MIDNKPYIKGGMWILAMTGFIVLVTVFMPRTHSFEQQPFYLDQYSKREQRGRDIYRREGCFYCHSQFARAQDWGHGKVAEAQDYFFDSPNLLGTERTGPDLSNEGNKMPDEWHVRHHRDPRTAIPGSVMPSFDHLNDEEMSDLVTYIQSLGEKGNRRLRVLLHTQDQRDDSSKEYGTPIDVRFNQLELTKAFIAQGNFLQLLEKEEKYKESKKPEDALTKEEQSRLEAMQRLVDFEAAHPEAPKFVVDRFKKSLANPQYKPINDSVKFTPDGKVNFERRFIVNGQGVYNQNCAVCHGLEGKGNGPAAPWLVKRPGNFADDRFDTYFTQENRGIPYYWRIKWGVPGNNMPFWGEKLTDEQVFYVMNFLEWVSYHNGLGDLSKPDYWEYPISNREDVMRLLKKVTEPEVNKALTPENPTTK